MKLVGEVALALVEELKMLVAIVCAQLLNPIGMQLLESVKLVGELVLLQLLRAPLVPTTTVTTNGTCTGGRVKEC